MNNPTGAGQLHNKTAVVTGGSRGIGRAIIDAVSYTHLTLPTNREV